MCSWCWGFAPTMERLVREHGVDLRLIVGGLRPGPYAQLLTADLREMLLHHWHQVEAVTGQPFDREALMRRPDTWRYDTELPATAVAVVRHLRPGDELAFLTHLQRAFYAEGVDITDPEEYPRLVAGFDVAADRFVDLLASDEARGWAWGDFDEARRLGVTGFPTTLLRIDGRHRLLSAGHRTYEELAVSLGAVVTGS